MSRPANIPGNLIVQQMAANNRTKKMVPYRGQKSNYPGPAPHFLCHLFDLDRAPVPKLFYNQDGRRWSQRNAENEKSEAWTNCPE